MSPNPAEPLRAATVARRRVTLPSVDSTAGDPQMTDPAGPWGASPARVVVVEPLGREALVTLDAGGVEVKALIGDERRPTVGTTVGFGYDPARVHLFDAEGRRL